VTENFNKAPAKARQKPDARAVLCPRRVPRAGV